MCANRFRPCAAAGPAVQAVEDRRRHAIYTFKVLFSSPENQKIFKDSPSHRILWHMYKILNIDENKN